ncbi:MAG: S24 family peptidase [Desulfatibacillaceae bacterium]
MSENDTKEQFWAALRYCYERSDFNNQEALASEASVSQSTISEMLSKKKGFRPPTQAKIARVFGYELIDFLALGRSLLRRGGPPPGQAAWTVGENRGQNGWEPSGSFSSRVSESQPMWGTGLESASAFYREVPVYETARLLEGPNGLLFDSTDAGSYTVAVSRSDLFGRENHVLAAMVMSDKSMEPTIPEGSTVVIDADDKVFVQGRLYVIRLPEQERGIIRRVQKWSKGYILMCDNPKEGIEPLELGWHNLCAGRVIRAWKNMENA